MHRYRRILVLGSGFSKSFSPSMPTLKDLSGELFAELALGFKPLQEFCSEFLHLVNGQPEYRKVEELATILLSPHLHFDEEQRLRFSELRWLLLRFVQQAVRRNDRVEGTSALALGKLLSNCANATHLRVRDTLLVSFNYDLLLENALADDPELSHRCLIDYGVPIEPADKPLRAMRTKDECIDLIKLHGSLNWYRIKGSLDLDIRALCQVGTQDRSWAIYQRENPVFIPMAHTKESHLRGNLFSVLWTKADIYLSQAEEIHFIGYGFPRSDINNLAMLLRHRERIRSVVIFEDGDENELDRIRRLFNPTIVHNQDAREWLSDHSWSS